MPILRTSTNARSAAPRPRRPPSLPLVALLAALASGCATLTPGVHETTLGRGSSRDIDLAVHHILSGAGFNVHGVEQVGRRMSYETDWMTRLPLPEEAAAGAELCRTRIIVIAHEVRPNLYSVRLRAENLAQTGAEWRPFEVRPSLQQHLDEVSMDIVHKIDAGVRVY